MFLFVLFKSRIMKKIYIHNCFNFQFNLFGFCNFCFYIKFYFIYFLVVGLRGERKSLKNKKEKRKLMIDEIPMSKQAIFSGNIFHLMKWVPLKFFLSFSLPTKKDRDWERILFSFFFLYFWIILGYSRLVDWFVKIIRVFFKFFCENRLKNTFFYPKNPSSHASFFFTLLLRARGWDPWSIFLAFFYFFFKYILFYWNTLWKKTTLVEFFHDS